MTGGDTIRGPGAEGLAAPLISHEPEECGECWGCVRHCPARALRVGEGGTSVITERCVKCGACVIECPNGGHVVRDDRPPVQAALASGAPVVCVLASEHIAALHPRTPEEVEQALGSLGFAGVETTALGEEIVAAAYEHAHARAGSSLPRLRSTCPVATDWVRRFYPELTGALVAVAPPYVVQARLVRQLYPPGAVIVYVSPCWARKDEALQAEFAGAVDVAIGFDELREMVDEGSSPSRGSIGGHRAHAEKRLSVTDGFPRWTLRTRDYTDRDIVTVRGLDDIDRLLTAIVRGETAPAIVDMLSCEGCIDGPCVNRELSVFAKRNIDIAERERQRPPSVDTGDLLATLPAVDVTRMFTSCPAPRHTPSDEEVDRVLEAGEFASRGEAIDCGVCGYKTCVEHAAAICLGNSTWEMCFPLARKRLTREREHFQAAAVTDGLTGLLNRRAFDERMAEEVERARRYGTTVSLVMVDLDGFKDVNDAHGHAAGDMLLRSVGTVLQTQLRITDHAVRYGGDEFALVLASTSKTEAWAVAEKVRSALRVLRVDVGGGTWVNATASVGVATLGETHATPQAILEAADSALYRAKRAGRDRVELASG